MEESLHYILVGDLGGTQIRFELYHGRNPLKKWHKLTKDSTNLIEDIKAAIESFQIGQNIQAAVFGIAGPVDQAKGIVPILVDIP
jgi:glucokinase